MKFETLIDMWSSLLNRSGSYFNFAWNKANAAFCRLDIPGGCPLCNNQSANINVDIEAFVQGTAGGTGWDNYIEFRPLTKRSKAARIAAKKILVPNVPESWFERSISTRYGWEIIQLLNSMEISKLDGVVLRPRLTVDGQLSNHYFKEWSKTILGEELNLTGPRQEAFLEIVLGGKDWKCLFPIK